MQPDAAAVPDAWARAGRLLCVRLDALGDVLMTTPAIRALATSLPRARITLLTSPSGAEAAALLPDVDDVMVHEAAWMKASRRRDPRGQRRFVRRLRHHRFDAAVIFTVFSQSALPAAVVCHLAGIPRVLAHARENPYHLLTDWVPEPEPEDGGRHEVRRQLDLVASIGCRTVDERLIVAVPHRARSSAGEVLLSSGVDPARPWVVIHPGGSAPSRRYPWERFPEIADRLAREHGWQVVFTGGGDEVELVERIQAAMEATAVSLAGRLGIPELAGVLERAPLLVSGNTGPVHVAAAVGTPVVDLYALTNPQHTPWMVPSRVLSHDVPCRWCYKSVCPEAHHGCLRLVEPDDVVRAAVELMAATRGAPQGSST